MVSAILMLLCNIVLELKLMNGSAGICRKIVYKSRDGPPGPNGPNEHPAYVIVNFPDAMIPEEEKLVPDMP